MLPDYPHTKRKLKNRLIENMKASISKQSDFLSKIRKSVAFEGDRTFMKRDDGTTFEGNFAELGTDILIPHEELKTMSPNDIKDKLATAAYELSEQQSRLTFDSIDKEVKKHGNTVSAKGRPFSVDQYLEGLEKLQIDFDPKTMRPLFPTLVAHPNKIKAMKKELEKLDNESTYKKRFEEIITEKKREWIARESNRKLVR